MYDYNQDDNVGTEALPYGQRAASDAHKLTKKLIKKQIQRRQIERARAQAAQQTSRAAAEAGKKLNVPTIMVCATPAAMNNPTPLPNPHLDTTSSRYNINIAPMTNCKIIIP